MLLSARIYIALGTWRFGDFRNIFLPNIGEDQKKSYDFSSGPLSGTQAVARNLHCGGCFGGLGAGPPVTRGQCRLADEAPSAQKFCIFLQNELNFKAILIENNAFKTWHRNRQPNMIQLVALMGYMGSG